MAFEVEVPVRHRTMWLAFTDPEKMARAVPGLTVDAVHAVPPADGPEGVAGDVVAGRLKLRVGGAAGATITYRGTACIAGAEAQKGTLDIAIDAAQARGNGALAGYLRVTLAAAGDAGERTLISVAPELELSGRALEFAREDWHEAVNVLGAAWIEVLAAEYAEAAEPAAAVPAEVAPAEAAVPAMAVVPASAEAETAAPAETRDANQDSVIEAPDSPEADGAGAPLFAEPSNKAPESLSEDPLAVVWSGGYEKNRWLPALTALALFLLIKRRRRHRADNAGTDSSFRME